MSDTLKEGGETTNTNVDPLNNIKQEFGRKLGNVETQVAELTKANQQLLAQLQNIATPKVQETTESLEDLWYKDPIKAASTISAATEKRIEEKMAKQAAAAQKSQQTLNSLAREYPELNDDSHPLTKKAIEIYNSLEESEKTSPMAYKLAVKEAAMELEVKPSSKRSYDDNYSMGSTGNTSGNRERGKRDEVDANTIAFARMLGRPVDDPKYMERLKQYSKRKTWTKYE